METKGILRAPPTYKASENTPYRGLATIGRLPKFCTSCNVEGLKLRLWAMWKLRASHGKHLKPCTQYPSPHKSNICWVPAGETPPLSSYALCFLIFLWYNWLGLTVMGFMKRVPGCGGSLMMLLEFWWRKQRMGLELERDSFGGRIQNFGITVANGFWE